jgi:hypothetical protein
MSIRPACLALACLCLGVACTPPGQGDKALAGYRASAGLIQALGEYHEKHGAYPDKLEQLVPEVLSAAQLKPPTEVARYTYERQTSGFVLTFNYHGPGTNDCAFDSAKRAWQCDGRF